MIRVLTALAISLIAIGITGLIITSLGKFLLYAHEFKSGDISPATPIALAITLIVLVGAMIWDAAGRRRAS